MGGITQRIPAMQEAMSSTINKQNIENTAKKYASFENPQDSYKSASGRRASFASRSRRYRGSMGAMNLDTEGFAKDLNTQMLKKTLGE
jgi:hypothetical protein